MKKIIPVSFPWMVSPSTPMLRLIVDENGDCLVRFVGFFLNESKQNADSINVVDAYDGLTIDPEDKCGSYQLISLSFLDAGWSRRSPQHSDRQVVDESLFDWSQIEGQIKAGEDAVSWQARFRSKWNETGVCPDSSVYIVEDSEWAKEVGSGRYEMKHYLILGESSYVEVLAKDFRWVSEGSLVGW
ncbi:hypothetical protein [Lysobacter hankyongensis]|uniref:Uncharacterized protein n=1 Tax=Lysobacter hankyongensis TaxID=1176535 RepID=A0ABP9BTR3_9GAMM